MTKTFLSRSQATWWHALPALALALILLSASRPACADTGPVVKITPSSMNFGAVKIGQSATASVTVANSGTSTLQTSLIKITGTQSGQFASNDKDWYTLGPGISATFTVTYKPTYAGTAFAFFRVASNDPRGTVGITLTGQGTTATPAPKLTASPTSVAFGSVAVGATSAAATVRLKNSGNATLNVTSLTLAGTNPDDFVLSSGTLPLQIAPGGNAGVNVSCSPAAAGPRAATLAIGSNNPGGTVTVPLSVQGLAPNLTVSPGSVSFGSVAVGASSSASTVLLKNAGTATLNVTSLALAGANPGDFVLSSTALPLQIAAGASASVAVTCKPDVAKTFTAALAIGSNNPGGTVTVPLSGQGTAPSLTVSPTSVSFGNIAVGATSAASAVTLKNTGSADLSVSSLTLVGVNPGDFVLSSAALPLQIPAGGSGTVSLMCKPTAAAALTAALAIGSNSLGGTVTVALSGQGTNGSPKAQLLPASLDFGAVDVGKSISKEFAVWSVGTQTLQTSNIQITGAQAAMFTSNDADWYTLGPGIHVTFTVTFTPTAAGAAGAQIEVTSNDPAGKTILPLTGSATATTSQPSLTVSPASVAFGSIAVGATSAASTVQLSNTGSAALSVSSLALSGTNAAEFTLGAPTLPLQIAAGASSSVTLAFKPAAAGSRTASLTVASNDPSGNVTVPLTGTGTVSQPSLQVSPASLAFGSVTVGATSAASAVQLSNTGSAALNITSLALSGTNGADFALSAPVVPMQIAAGGSSTVSLTFTPAAAGARTASLVIGSNSPAGNVAVALSGTGRAPTATDGSTTHPNDGSVLGTNLSPISDWSPEWAFVDCFKTSRPWYSGELWVFSDSRTLPLDANGWPTSLQSGQVARTLLFWDQVNTYPSGDYIVLYDGTGTLAYQGAATKVSGTAGRDVVRVDASRGGWQLLITATTPADYLRNIRVLMPGGSSAQDPYSWYADAASCPYSDYKSFEQTYQTQPFHPMFLNTVKSYKVLRFMDWMSTNNSTQTNWSDRPTPSDARWSIKGVPVEIMCSLANTIHADPWFNLPHLATDDYLAKFAGVVRDQLAPDLRAYIEYSNEVWNGGFGQAQYAQQQGLALGLDASPYVAESSFAALRSVQMFGIFEQVLGGTSRIRRVLATQAAGWYLGEVQVSYNNAYQHADVLAIAPYFAGGLGDPANETTTQAMNLDQLFTAIYDSELPPVYERIRANAALAAKYGLELVAYEGGTSLGGYYGVENNDTITALCTAANRDARMGQVYTDYLNTWKSCGGGMFIHYLNCLNYTKWGYWGSIERLDQTQTPKFTALQQFIEDNR